MATWTRVTKRLPADRQTVLIALRSPHYHAPITYDVAVFCARGFADDICVKDYAWERGAGWGFDRDTGDYIVAWAPFKPFVS